jgi:hypothetical protein
MDQDYGLWPPVIINSLLPRFPLLLGAGHPLRWVPVNDLIGWHGVHRDGRDFRHAAQGSLVATLAWYENRAAMP